MPQATMSARVAENRRRRRGQVLQAALRAFRDKGYHGTTLEDIAARLGVRNTALYHYFPDKESILFACHQESLAEVERILATARAEHTGPRDRLMHVVREHVRVMIETLEGAPLGFEVAVLSPPRQAEVIAARDRYEQGVRALVHEGCRQRVFRPVDPKVATFAIMGAINWIARWYHHDGAIDSDQLGSAFAEYLVGGLTCR